MKTFIKLFFTFALFSQFSFSQVQLKNFSFNYKNPSGFGSFDFLQFKEHVYDQKFFKLLYDGEDIDIVFDDDNVEFPKLPEFIKKVKSINVEKFNLKSDLKQVQDVAWNKANFVTKDYSINMTRLQAKCRKLDKNDKSNLDFILKYCLKGLVGSLDFFSYLSGDKPFILTQPALRILNNKIRLTGKLDYIIKGNLQIDGLASLNERNKVLTIEITSAKLGVLKIRKRIVNLISKIKSDRVRVRDPFIYIDYGPR